MRVQAAPGNLGRGLARLREIAASLTLQPAAPAFYFLRHGQTARNALRIFQSPDEPLDPIGRGQAVDAAGVLASEALAKIACSDTLRTRETAALVAARVGVEPVPVAALRERNFGALIGTSSVDLDWDCAPHNGETLGIFVQRTRDALAHALADTAPVLVIAHGGTLHVLAALLGIPVTPSLLANAQPLRFERQTQGWSAIALGAARLAPVSANLA